MATAVKIWPDIWEKGQPIAIPDNVRTTYASAAHPGASAKCIEVKPGFKARFHSGKDGTGKTSTWFEAGKYYDLSFYHDAWKGGDHWMIEVLPVEHTPEALATLYDNGPWLENNKAKFGAWYRIPPGKHNDRDDVFVNDSITSVAIPAFHTMELYEHGGFQGAKLELEGPGTYNLPDYGWNDRVSSIILKPDEVEIIKIDYEVISEEVMDTMAGKTLATNASKSVPLTTDVEVSGEVSKTQEWNWNMEAGVSLSVGASAEVGLFGTGVEVSTELTASMSAGYGESDSETETKGYRASVGVTLEPGQSVECVMMARVKRMKMKATRTWRSKRTGAVVNDWSYIETDTAIETEVFARDPEPL